MFNNNWVSKFWVAFSASGAGAPKEDNAGNVNTPGGSDASKMSAEPGHGAEKKSKPETADNKKSTIGS